jgi:hypothetical protein
LEAANFMATGNHSMGMLSTLAPAPLAEAGPGSYGNGGAIGDSSESPGQLGTCGKLLQAFGPCMFMMCTLFLL